LLPSSPPCSRWATSPAATSDELLRVAGRWRAVNCLLAARAGGPSPRPAARRARPMVPRCLLFLTLVSIPARAADAPPLPGTKPLTEHVDFSVRMRKGIEKYLLREIAASVETRKTLWKRDFSSRAAYEKSVEPNRERFRHAIGVVDARLPITELEYVTGTASPAEAARTKRYSIPARRWPVLE